MPQREMEGEEDIYLFFVLATGLQLEKKKIKIHLNLRMKSYSNNFIVDYFLLIKNKEE